VGLVTTISLTDGAGRLTVGRPTGGDGDAAANAPLATVQFDPPCVGGLRDIAWVLVVVQVNRHGTHLSLGIDGKQRPLRRPSFRALEARFGSSDLKPARAIDLVDAFIDRTGEDTILTVPKRVLSA